MTASLLLLLLQAAPPMLGPVGQQALPARGCAAYLWRADGDRALVGYAAAGANTLRLSVDGKAVTLARSATRGDAGFGFAGEADYASEGLAVTLTMNVQTREDLSKGALVTDAMLKVGRVGGDTVVLPVGGLIGCSG